MPAVLVTGATGFAGSSLVQQYAERGWEVHGTYKDPGDFSWLPAGVTLHHLDMQDAAAVDALVGRVRPDVVQHLAAQSSVSASLRAPLETLQSNARMQFNLLEAIVQQGLSARFVAVGSCDEYGDVPPDQNPVTEEQELRPVSPYGLSKVVQDLMGLQYFEAYDVPVVRVRPFLQIGPRREDRFVAGSFARQVVEIAEGIRPPVIEVGSIDLRRDFSDVRDVARAYVLAAEFGAPGEVYNICSGTHHSLREMLQLMLEFAGVRAEIRQNPDLVRRAEPPLLVGDATRLRNASGWVPVIPWERAVGDTLRYWQERMPARGR